MSDQDNTPVDGEAVGTETTPVDLSAMTETQLRERHTELAARRDELMSKDKSVAELAELAEITNGMNDAAEAINKFNAPAADVVEIVESIVPDEVPAEDAPAAEADDAPVGDEGPTETATTDGDEVVEVETVEVAPELVDAVAAALAAKERDDVDKGDDDATGLPAVAASRETAPIVASAAAQNLDAGQTMSLGEMGAALQTAMINGAGRNGDVIIASINPYGNKPDQDDQALGGDARRNHQILHPENPDYISVTAAIGCAPAEPPREIPSMFMQDEPVLGTLTEQRVNYGQIQLYNPSQLDPNQTGLMIPGPECDGVDANGNPNCTSSVELKCASVPCIEPNEPVKVIPFTACICVPDDLQFSADYVLADQLDKLNASFAKGKELYRLSEIRKQSIVRQFTPPYGAKAGVKQAALQIAALVKNNQRQAGSFEGYQMVFHGGDMYTMMADAMNRTWGVDNAMDDMMEELRRAGVSDFVELIDHDPAESSVDGAQPRPVINPTLVGNANAAPLEPFYSTPSIYLYRRDSFITGSPFSTQLGFGDREKDELASGCSKMIMRQYWLPPTFYGTRPAFAIDFTEFCASGSGPDRQTPVCAGAVAGGSGPDLP